jgi:hypothetical protein
MCRNIRDYDPKTRRIWACGNLCLSTGLVLSLYATSFEHRHADAFAALRGFFMGMAIVFLFWSSRRMRSLNSRP